MTEVIAAVDASPFRKSVRGRIPDQIRYSNTPFVRSLVNVIRPPVEPRTENSGSSSGKTV